MALEGVPWMIGSGAEHSAEVGRLMAYAAVGGGEGVVGAGDFKVTASVSPNGNINIAAGGLACLNASAGGGQQSYLLRNTASIVKAMTPQGAGGPRYDLVAVIVEDPQYPGQPSPPDIADGPYCSVVVYENVGSTVTTLAEVDPGQTGYALARVAFTASDSTVTAAEITDLRSPVQSRRKSVTRLISPGSTTAVPSPALGVGPPGASWTVPIPKWATRVLLEVQWSGILGIDSGAGTGSAVGVGQAELGTLQTDAVAYQMAAPGASKQTSVTVISTGDLAIPSAMRGTDQTMRAMINKNASPTGMTVSTTVWTTCVVKAEFYEDVE